jgi:Cu/Ag efflux protein CusF
MFALAFVFIGCKGADEEKAAGAGREYDIRGKVVEVDAGKPAVTLYHDDIPGLMKAMKMQFSVKDATLLEGIKAGDEVQGRLHKGPSGYVITRLEKRTPR